MAAAAFRASSRSPFSSSRAGGVQGLLQVSLLQQSGIVMSPDASQTVGLQLHADGKGIGLRPAQAGARRGHLVGDAQKVLHVVSRGQ